MAWLWRLLGKRAEQTNGQIQESVQCCSSHWPLLLWEVEFGLLPVSTQECQVDFSRELGGCLSDMGQVLAFAGRLVSVVCHGDAATLVLSSVLGTEKEHLTIPRRSVTLFYLVSSKNLFT